uniref:RNA-directed RNA polymerase n=1 Tax=Lysobacter sp. ATCC 53042 TaxID=324869 RepID=F8TUI5_9GAMM|nr:RNA-directed RNA polymerase [Lysobacter sp. ATCC 53042]
MANSPIEGRISMRNVARFGIKYKAMASTVV